MDILFLQTGGTIDKDYLPVRGKAYNFVIAEPAFKKLLARLKVTFTPHFKTLAKKDSTEITNADRARIRRECLKSTFAHIVITHGTDTMLKTAKHLEWIDGKTVVLTGSFLPERLKGSDADFNLGIAVAAAQCLPPGMYIAMNGRVHHWRKCKKVRDVFKEKSHGFPPL